MPDAERYRAIVIGSGQAGGPLANDLARAGWKTAVFAHPTLTESLNNLFDGLENS